MSPSDDQQRKRHIGGCMQKNPAIRIRLKPDDS